MDKRVSFATITRDNFDKKNLTIVFKCWAKLLKYSGAVLSDSGKVETENKFTIEVRTCKLLESYLLNIEFDINNILVIINKFEYKITGVNETKKDGYLYLGLKTYGV